MSEVRIEHVFKRFGDVTAVSDFDLTVKDGEFVSLLGPSGCGKTTSLRMIAGFERATEGEIYIGDHCVSSHIKNTFVPPEPLSNLDAKLRESMRFEISSIQKELGITVIYVTHDQSEAMTMSDRVVVMSRGVIQQIGTPYEIYRNPANKMVADFIGLVNFVEGEVQGDRVYISGTGVSFPNTSGITGSATIAVRPENITMSRTSGTIEGTLVHRFYLGDAVDYRVQCKHHVIRVIVKGAELKEFTDGEKVYLDFDKIMVFDRD